MTASLLFIEVPLLFESHMEKDFDFIIATDIDSSLQFERLKKRNPSSSLDLLTINQTNQFLTYRDKCDFVISNNGSLSQFKRSVNEVIDKVKSHLK